MWSAASGFVFVLLNTTMRGLAAQVGPLETQFLRYAFGFVVMLPFILRAGWRQYMPRSVASQFVRGGVHTLGLLLWFYGLAHITIADTTAIGFTTPIFIMLGAAWMLKESMRWERWVAAGIGFAGVVIVVAPKLGGSSGWYTLVNLASAPVFALSYLITKSLTRQERVAVIVVWQAITISLLSLPLTVTQWATPSAAQFLAFVACGCMGSLGHYLLTRSFLVTDISATQSVKFLDLVWATLLGWLAFGDMPSRSTLTGGVVICASTLWIAQREARRAR
jgi:drug/metabolite transporter (DMT)-like permease